MALYHSAKGSVDYTIVGSPTIVDGVASGFSASDYLQINSQTIVPDMLEFAGKFTMGPNGEGGFIFHNFSVSNGIGLAVRPTSSSNQGMLLYAGTSHYVFYTNRFEAGTTHTYKVLYNKSSGVCYLYVDDELRRTLDTSEYTVYFGDTLYIGRYGTDWFGGSIDLKHTYITVNGQPWFGICPVEVKKHQIMGPVGYTVVGSPTITSGVVSGFSSGSYITTEGDTDFNQPFEISISCIKGPNRNQSIFSRRTQNNGVDVTFPYNSRCTIRLWLNNSAIYNVNEDMGGFALEENTKYIMKFTYDGDDRYYFAILNNITKDILYSRTIIESTKLNNCGVTFGGLFGGSALYNPWEGSIDFNETYIKVNGKLWFWQPQETKYIQRNNQLVWADPRLYLSGPVNYTVVGSPTIVDGVVSDFTLQDRIITSQNAPTDDITKYSFHIKFKMETIETSQSILTYTSSNREGITTSNTGVLRWQIGRVSGTTSDVFINSSISISQGDEILAEGFYKGNNTFAFRVSKDGGQTWTEDTVTRDLSILNPVRTNLPFYIGTWSDSRSYGLPFKGTIDLNNTYIKVNNELWFYGKNYASQNIAPVPAGYTYDNTTTSAIGYVDMRTQTFYSAPQGTTLGRDE